MSSVLDQHISEAAFQASVIRLARLRGWRVFHARAALTAKGRHMTPVAGDGAGFPDLLMVRGTRAIAAELKTEKGRLSPRQVEWLAAFRDTPVETFVWRPRDWDDLERTLK